MATKLTLEQKLEKIQNLMARARGTNSDAEAQVCILKAQELMVKWNLEESQVTDHTEKQETVREVAYNAGGMKAEWKSKLATVIANNFRCRWFFSGRGSSRYIVFFGFKEDARIARELYEKAIKLVEKGQQKCYDYFWWRKMPTYGVKGDYALGFVQGLKEAFQNQVDEQGWGLVVVTPKEVNEAYDKIEWDTKSTWSTSIVVARGNAQAREMGRVDGKELVPSKKKRLLEGGN